MAYLYVVVLGLPLPDVVIPNLPFVSSINYPFKVHEHLNKL